jgi:hypothetical protein
MERVSNDDAINLAVGQAPAESRAAIRGELVRRFSNSIGGLSWGGVVLRTATESWMADLGEYLNAESVEGALEQIRSAADLDDLTNRLRVEAGPSPD